MSTLTEPTLDDQIKAALRRLPTSTNSEIHWRVDRDSLVLTGHVRSYFEKQLVQESIREAAWGLTVCNDLGVTSSG